MEKYFIVKNEDLIEKLKTYEVMRIKVDTVFAEFRKQYCIETSMYYQSVDVLKIVPTEKDRVSFSAMLKVDGETFKKHSFLNKQWVTRCKEHGLTTPVKPSWELHHLIGGHIYRFRSRLFSYNGTVYGSFESDGNFTLPEEHFVELKASEFYKIIETIQGES